MNWFICFYLSPIFVGVLSLSFLLSARWKHSLVGGAHTHLGAPAVGARWTTMTMSWELFTWPTCVLRASQATPPATCCTSHLWPSVSGCVEAGVRHVCVWSPVKAIKASWSCTHYIPPCSLSEARPSIKCGGPTGGGTGNEVEGHLGFTGVLEVSRQLLRSNLSDQIQTSHVLILSWPGACW